MSNNPSIIELVPQRQRSRAHCWTGHVAWYTPDWFLGLVSEALSGIELDPTSSDEAVLRATVKPERYLTYADNPLMQDWRARTTFMNPPYARGLVDRFTGKFVDHYLAGDIEAGIVLVNTCTGAAWCRKCLDACTALCFVTGRIRFDKGAGTVEGTPHSPTHDNLALYFGPHPERFVEVFSRCGWARTTR
jgi:hypothetical protein